MTANFHAKTVMRPSNRQCGFGIRGLLSVIAIFGLLVALWLPVRRSVRPAHRSQCKNNLKQIWIALSGYESVYHALPPAYTVDADGNPLHSWRTLILPYLEQKELYAKIDLTKAWDHPVNAEALKSNVLTYRCPSADGPANYTNYMAVVTSNSCFHPTEPRPLSEITDNQMETLLVIEMSSDHAVPWMAPRDADEAMFLAINPTSRLDHTGGMHAAFVDGTVRFLSDKLQTDIRRAFVTIAGNEQLPDY